MIEPPMTKKERDEIKNNPEIWGKTWTYEAIIFNDALDKLKKEIRKEVVKIFKPVVEFLNRYAK